MTGDSVKVRPARADEAELVGELTELAYRFDGYLNANTGYAAELRDGARRIRDALVLVAERDGAVVGTVTLACAGSPYAEIAQPGELEVRMLAVAPWSRRRGVASALARAAEALARSGGLSAVVLCTGAWMSSAQRLYEHLGYRRLSERDWSAGDRRLLAYRLALDDALRLTSARMAATKRSPDQVSPAQASGRSVSTKLGLAVVVTAVLMTAIDTTIVVLALPEIERGLHVALASVIWVVIGYLLTVTLLATQVGRLGDMFGRVRMYELGFVVFLVGSALCALAWDEASIIVFRALQGIGGALVTANSGAVIADLFGPERRGRAYGFTAMGYSIGAVLGIALGGVIVTYLSWRWIFWINVPIGVVAVAVALRVLRDSGERRGHRLDWAGMLAAGMGLFGVLWAVTNLATHPLDGEIVGFLAGGVVLLAVFVAIERGQSEPMVRLSIFRIPTMSPALGASFFQGLANYAVLFLVIMYLQGPRGLTPLQASGLLVPGYVLGGFIGPLSGRLADRIGPVIPATFGLAIQVGALLLYAHLGLRTGLWLVVLASVIGGMGNSSFFPANNSAVMRAAPPEAFGIASGMLRTFQNTGMVFSFSIAILIASRSISRRLAFAIFVGAAKLHGHVAAAFTSGLHSAFYASMGFFALAALLSATRLRTAPGQPTGHGARAGVAAVPQVGQQAATKSA
jgi:EmrB/QacA subfamily drug resistance transporter